MRTLVSNRFLLRPYLELYFPYRHTLVVTTFNRFYHPRLTPRPSSEPDSSSGRPSPGRASVSPPLPSLAIVHPSSEL